MVSCVLVQKEPALASLPLPNYYFYYDYYYY